MKLKRFEDLKGHTLTSVEKTTDSYNDDRLIFTLFTGEQYMLYHSQDCCENVYIEDIDNDLSVLVDSPILVAEKVTSDENPDNVDMGSQDCFTWTFYKLATAKGHVTIRWYGESNGYYSESVDWCLL